MKNGQCQILKKFGRLKVKKKSNILTFHKHKASKIRTKRPPSTASAYIHHARGFSFTISKLGMAIVVAWNKMS